MKRLNQALLAIFLACGVYAESQGEYFRNRHRMEIANSGVAPDECPQTIPLEVVVWVNENGIPISTQTDRMTATSTLQEHVSGTTYACKPKPSLHEHLLIHPAASCNRCAGFITDSGCQHNPHCASPDRTSGEHTIDQPACNNWQD